MCCPYTIYRTRSQLSEAYGQHISNFTDLNGFVTLQELISDFIFVATKD